MGELSVDLADAVAKRRHILCLMQLHELQLQLLLLLLFDSSWIRVYIG